MTEEPHFNLFEILKNASRPVKPLSDEEATALAFQNIVYSNQLINVPRVGFSDIELAKLLRAVAERFRLGGGRVDSRPGGLLHIKAVKNDIDESIPSAMKKLREMQKAVDEALNAYPYPKSGAVSSEEMKRCWRDNTYFLKNIILAYPDRSLIVYSLLAWSAADYDLVKEYQLLRPSLIKVKSLTRKSRQLIDRIKRIQNWGSRVAEVEMTDARLRSDQEVGETWRRLSDHLFYGVHILGYDLPETIEAAVDELPPSERFEAVYGGKSKKKIYFPWAIFLLCEVLTRSMKQTTNAVVEEYLAPVYRELGIDLSYGDMLRDDRGEGRSLMYFEPAEVFQEMRRLRALLSFPV